MIAKLLINLVLVWASCTVVVWIVYFKIMPYVIKNYGSTVRAKRKYDKEIEDINNEEE